MELKSGFVKKETPELEVKAWTNDLGVSFVEGWISTPDEDLEHDVTVPEAFLDAMDGYLTRGGPLSSEHDTKKYPVGHAQKIAVVRDGQILKEGYHPSDSADFEHFPNIGTGVYGRFAITEPEAVGAVRKGNVRGFSYIAKPVETEPLPTGGRTLKRLEPWFESTIAAYPVNSKAVMLAAKAITEPNEAQEGDSMDMDALKAALAEVLASQQSQLPKEEVVTKADVEAQFGAFKSEISALVADMVAKALPTDREGTGRKGTVETGELTLESDPIQFLVKKARTGASTEDYTQDEKAVLAGLTLAAILDGMKE
jgi:hypothetical protein